MAVTAATAPGWICQLVLPAETSCRLAVGSCPSSSEPPQVSWLVRLGFQDVPRLMRSGCFVFPQQQQQLQSERQPTQPTQQQQQKQQQRAGQQQGARQGAREVEQGPDTSHKTLHQSARRGRKSGRHGGGPSEPERSTPNPPPKQLAQTALKTFSTHWSTTVDVEPCS
jgi:hypothetical protein